MTPEEVKNYDGIYELAKIVKPQNLELGDPIEISDFVFLNAGNRTVIGDYSCIHSGSRIIGGGELLVRDGVAVTYNCVLVTSYPRYTSHMSTCVPKREKDTVKGTIEIKDEAFIGSNSVVMPNVTIGEGAVISALSYVDEDVPPWTVRFPDGQTVSRQELETYTD